MLGLGQALWLKRSGLCRKLEGPGGSSRKYQPNSEKRCVGSSSRRVIGWHDGEYLRNAPVWCASGKRGKN